MNGGIVEEYSGMTRRRLLQLTGTTAFAAAALGIAGCKQEEGETEPVSTEFKLSVYDPTGKVEITQSFTPRLDTLDGKTIAFLGNGMWEEERCFELLEKLMKENYPTTTIITADNFPRKSDKLTQDNNGIAAMMKELGVDGVVVGNAG